MHVCDNCKGEMRGNGVTIQFGYPSILDGNEHEFCSDKCAITYLMVNWVNKVK